MPPPRPRPRSRPRVLRVDGWAPGGGEGVGGRGERVALVCALGLLRCSLLPLSTSSSHDLHFPIAPHTFPATCTTL